MNSEFKLRREMVYLPKIIEVEGIYIKPSIKKYQNMCIKSTKQGILYNKSGMLIYNGSDGNVTVIANS